MTISGVKKQLNEDFANIFIGVLTSNNNFSSFIDQNQNISKCYNLSDLKFYIRILRFFEYPFFIIFTKKDKYKSHHKICIIKNILDYKLNRSYFVLRIFYIELRID